MKITTLNLKKRTSIQFQRKFLVLLGLVLFCNIATFAQLNSNFETLIYNNPAVNGADFTGTGWVHDVAYPANTQIPVDVFVDNIWKQRVFTNIARQDVTNWFGYTNGNLFGFQFGINGLDYSIIHKVDIYMTAFSGAVVFAGTKNTTIESHLNSNFESLNYNNPPVNGTDFTGSGWVHDTAYPPNTPIPVEVYVDGVWNQEVMTNIARQDVTDWFHYNN